MLESVFSYGSSLFSSKRCIRLTLYQKFCLLTLCRMATFADCVGVSPSLVSLAVGKEAVDWK